MVVCISLIPAERRVYNVLEHKAETEKIIFEDTDPENGFILSPDLWFVSCDVANWNRKWDGTTISSLYLLAILHRRDLSSIRDLNESHIHLLRTIQTRIIEATVAKWPEVAPDQLRLYFHCSAIPCGGLLTLDHPSYYHMHIHVVHTDFQGSDGMSVGKAWLLDDVIEQLSYLSPEGFKRKTITFIIGEESDLWRQVYSKLTTSSRNLIT